MLISFCSLGSALNFFDYEIPPKPSLAMDVFSFCSYTDHNEHHFFCTFLELALFLCSCLKYTNLK